MMAVVMATWIRQQISCYDQNILQKVVTIFYEDMVWVVVRSNFTLQGVLYIKVWWKKTYDCIFKKIKSKESWH